MVRWSRDVSETNISQAHPLFFVEVGTDTRYFTAQHQHLFSSNLMNMLRFAANRTGRDNDLIPTIEIPTSLYFSEDPHWGAINISHVSTAGSIATIPVGLQARHLPAVGHAHVERRAAHVMKVGFDWQNYHSTASRIRDTAASSGSGTWRSS